jgi:2-haloacid dehalogenase
VGRLPDVHVAQSHFHDVVPATALGIPTVWINRLGETGDPPPTRRLPTLTGLADTLDELVPAA